MGFALAVFLLIVALAVVGFVIAKFLLIIGAIVLVLWLLGFVRAQRRWRTVVQVVGRPR